jgi:hypothetical protein
LKRYLISIAGGLGLITVGSILASLFFVPFKPEFICAFIFFWPAMLLGKLGVGPDCANANEIPDKLNCFGLSFIDALIVYVVIIGTCSFLIYRKLGRHFPPPAEPAKFILFNSNEPE